MSTKIRGLTKQLFNATSVQEAAKSSTQNKYIFVSTVATVIYLSTVFLTCLFGMHLFDSTYPDFIAGPPKFWITIAVLSLGTYAVDGWGYWLARTENVKWSHLKERIKNMDGPDLKDRIDDVDWPNLKERA
ncbi:hypothetical protein BJ878DRAFT_481365 [Calycina marina]|uniref:Uncharacterized protein n=1 Tax=Calycina marina TaxID=1763456 RepID=A0A9P8CFB8_9HELO|nr:hypothetical protein BJ878DRAFT_481365 [Calycina marina]